jgi:hypothetical protein
LHELKSALHKIKVMCDGGEIVDDLLGLPFQGELLRAKRRVQEESLRHPKGEGYACEPPHLRHWAMRRTAGFQLRLRMMKKLVGLTLRDWMSRACATCSICCMALISTGG